VVRGRPPLLTGHVHQQRHPRLFLFLFLFLLLVMVMAAAAVVLLLAGGSYDLRT
jgi:hypothetical protein